MTHLPDGLRVSDVSFLPIVAAYVKKLGIVETVNRLCPDAQSDVTPGHMVAAMILDTLSGRSPLYRLEKAFKHLDVELLLGSPIRAEQLNDDAAARTLDRVARVGTGPIFSSVALTAANLFRINTRHVHHDTTSRTVYGHYDLYQEPDHGHPFEITHGFSKDHRPDLKQLVHSLLCVDHGIPIYMKCESGNASDKKINESILKWVVDGMRRFGQRDILYVADSALITRANLDLMEDPKTGCRFVSRLPSLFTECKLAIRRAVDANAWTDQGSFSCEPESAKHPHARYRSFETEVSIYDRSWRVVVFHSDAHDLRKTRALEKRLKDDKKEMAKHGTDREKIEFACRPDAEAAFQMLSEGTFHRLIGDIQEIPHYRRGRPRADGASTVTHLTYRLRLRVEPKAEAIALAEKETGCFVLITNVPLEGPGALDSRELLAAYKDQHYIERNFGFLKDPVIVNSLFLKTPSRIEALGLILVLSLLVWRLMERTMRLTLKETGSTVRGWEKRQTSRPTTFMMTIAFQSVIVLHSDQGRLIPNDLNATQRAYLRILRVPPEVFTDPRAGLDLGRPDTVSHHEDPG
jgi:transposase